MSKIEKKSIIELSEVDLQSMIDDINETLNQANQVKKALCYWKDELKKMQEIQQKSKK